MLIQEVISKNIGMPLKSLIKNDSIYTILNELNESQYYSRERMRLLQTERLKKLLCFIFSNNPFYSDVINKLGANPDYDDPWEIFHELPLLDKEAYKVNRERLCNPNSKRRPNIGYTSGTTGEQLEYYLDKSVARYLYLSGYRGRSWSGIEPGDIELKIWGSGIHTSAKKGITEILHKSLLWCIGKYLINPVFETDEDYWQAIDVLFKAKPKFVFGYANSLHSLASFMLRNNIKVGPEWPKIASYTSEMLYEWQKDDIKQAFNCPLMSEYGSAEFGIMAYTCPNGNFHISDDILIMEIFNNGIKQEDGQFGEIVVTNLMSYNHPMIRYRQGDMGIVGGKQCTCNLGLQVLSSLKGRMNDQLISPSGKPISFLGFAHAIKGQTSLKRFKVVERGTGDLVLLYEPHVDSIWADNEQKKFIETASRLLPNDVCLTIGYVGVLHNDKSGKFRVIIPQKESQPYLEKYVSRK